jgi:hypothetical protein
VSTPAATVHISVPDETAVPVTGAGAGRAVVGGRGPHLRPSWGHALRAPDPACRSRSLPAQVRGPAGLARGVSGRATTGPHRGRLVRRARRDRLRCRGGRRLRRRLRLPMGQVPARRLPAAGRHVPGAGLFTWVLRQGDRPNVGLAGEDLRRHRDQPSRASRDAISAGQGRSARRRHRAARVPAEVVVDAAVRARRGDVPPRAGTRPGHPAPLDRPAGQRGRLGRPHLHGTGHGHHDAPLPAPVLPVAAGILGGPVRHDPASVRDRPGGLGPAGHPGARHQP